MMVEMGDNKMAVFERKLDKFEDSCKRYYTNDGFSYMYALRLELVKMYREALEEAE